MPINVERVLAENLYNSMQLMNNAISDNISYLLTQILTNYDYISENNKDIHKSYIHKYIQCNVAKHICYISNFILDRLNSYTDKESLNYLSRLRNNSNVIEELYQLAFNNKELLIVNDNISERVDKEWEKLESKSYKLYKKLFKTKEEYLYNTISLHDFLRSINLSKLKKSSSTANLIKFIADFQHEEVIDNSKNNNDDSFYTKLFSFDKVLVKELSLLNKKQTKQTIMSNFKKYIDSQNNMENYILEKVINPIVWEIISNFDKNKKININEVNEYINLNYRNSCITYNEILFSSILFKDNQNTNISKAILENLYLDNLYKFSKGLVIDHESKVNNFNLLSKKFVSIYKDKTNYDTLLLFINYDWINNEKLITIIKERFEERMKYEEDRIKEMESLEPSKLYTAYQAIYQNKGNILLGIIIVAVSVCFYLQYRKLKTLFSVINSIYNTASGVGNSVYDTASDVGNSVYNTVSGVGSSVYDTASDVGNSVYNTVSGVGNSVSSIYNSCVKNPLTDSLFDSMGKFALLSSVTGIFNKTTDKK